MLETANRLRDSGKEQEAETLLRQQPPSTRIDLTLADWAEQRGDHEAAKTAYNTILQREPQNEDAILGLTEVYLARGQQGRGARGAGETARGTERRTALHQYAAPACHGAGRTG
ncbi:tetratricopeptide repeat protein [Enterobacter hormaechei]|nr:tetratricopeptide repeat protein [Enterobacter hormaechei]